eukprot:g42586.t1
MSLNGIGIQEAHLKATYQKFRMLSLCHYAEWSRVGAKEKKLFGNLASITVVPFAQLPHPVSDSILTT